VNQKTFFAILGLFVFLCILCSGLGILRSALNEGGQADPPTGLRDKLTQQLSVNDLVNATPARCRSLLQEGAFTLDEGEDCRLTIKSSNLPVRALSLQITRGDSVRVITNPNEENRLTAEQTLSGGKRTKAQIFQEGGTLEIACLSGGSGGTCEITTGE
jgi:hypothetical protein